MKRITARLLPIMLIISSYIILNSCSKIKTHEANYPHSEVTSQEITVYSSEWVGDGDGYEATKLISNLTEEIATEGAVMCYYKDVDGYIAMPLTMSYGSYVSHWLFKHDFNSVTFLNYDDDGATLLPENTTFKVVTISPVGLILNPNIDLMNYEEVEKAFNL